MFYFVRDIASQHFTWGWVALLFVAFIPVGFLLSRIVPMQVDAKAKAVTLSLDRTYLILIWVLVIAKLIASHIPAWITISDVIMCAILGIMFGRLGGIGKGFVNTGLAALTSANNDRLISFAAYNNEVEPARADQRAFFEDVFSAASGASTRASLLALWKRLANRGEKILATGTGSEASPATLTFEGSLSPDDVQQARES